MRVRHAAVLLFVLGLTVSSTVAAAGKSDWWNPRWRMRTTVVRATPYRDETPRPVEVAIDFPLLLKQAGVAGQFDPGSIRVLERDGRREVPFAQRKELNAETGGTRTYLTWIARPRVGKLGAFDVYFDTKDRGIEAPRYDVAELPPENLPRNPGFEQTVGSRPTDWKFSSSELARLGRFPHTTGERSLSLVVDEETRKNAERDVTVSQKVDVSRWAGREMVFECDLLAERAAYGAPVSIELEQHRADGSRILEYAIEPRWLTIELAQGQLVQFRQRGRFSHEAATVTVRIRLRLYVRDADTRRYVTGPESFFTVWLDRMVVRPGERWPWPPASHAGFVKGALAKAPINRGFEFTGPRRLAFNGASEGTLTAGKYNPDTKSAHWALETGTLEFWCRPGWDADDGREHVFFEGIAYGHRRQSRLRKLDAAGGNRLEFTIADAGCKLHTIRGPAPFRTDKWHHIAATWDFPRAKLQLFVDGKPVAAEGSAKKPWPSSLVAVGGKKKTPGIGIMEKDTRSLPMQAFIGGDRNCGPDTSAEAVLDEFRVSDVARYSETFDPPREELATDQHTRVLFHFENERHGIHGGDDRFVRGHLACELPRQEEKVPLEIHENGKIDRRMILVKPRASPELFESNRAESRLVVTRPPARLPDPRYVEYRRRRVERDTARVGDEFNVEVGGDYEPWMESIIFRWIKDAAVFNWPIPRWRANDNVLPFSVRDIAATLAVDAKDDAQRAFEAMEYALAVTNYYDAHYCETLPGGRHRPRISYSLIKAINIYPFDQCGPLNHTLRKLFLAVGVSSNDASGTHHQFQQAFYGGRWRLFDLSPRLYWLARDNAAVVGRPGFEDDPWLKLRQGSGVTSGIRGRVSRARFGTAERPYNMDFLLRGGERASFCWHNEGRWFELTGNRQPIPLAKIPPYFGNGVIEYEPRADGTAEIENITGTIPDEGPAVLRTQDPGRTATLIYRVQCPYIFSDATVLGDYTAQEPGDVKVYVSLDNRKTYDKQKDWKEVWTSPEKAGRIGANLREHVSGRYMYWLKVEFAKGHAVEVKGLKVRGTFVVSPLALPGKLALGKNRIRFVGNPKSDPAVTSCRWIERHKTDLGVSLDSIGYYMDGGRSHRNLLVVRPGEPLPVRVTLRGRALQGVVAIEGLPDGWSAQPTSKSVAIDKPDVAAGVELTVKPLAADAGAIHAFDVVVREGRRRRRVPAVVLVADAPLVREAEKADRITGDASVAELAELSGARQVVFGGDGRLAFDIEVARQGKYALWLRARWEPESEAGLTLAIDGGGPRGLRATAMIGFTDWTNPAEAHTKMFSHFGEQFGHWSWYRVPDVELGEGRHRLILGAGRGARFDAVLLLPRNPTMDRAAMNLFQNWNYAPWDNPF